MIFMICALCCGELDVLGESEGGFVKITKCLDCGAQLKQKRRRSNQESGVELTNGSPAVYVRRKVDIT